MKVNFSVIIIANPNVIIIINFNIVTAVNLNIVTTFTSDIFIIYKYVELYYKKYLTINQFIIYTEIQYYRAYARRMNIKKIKNYYIDKINKDLIRFNGEDIRINK